MSYQLKNRIAFAVSVLTLGILLSVTWLALGYFETRFRETVEDQVTSALEITAKETEVKLRHAQRSLRLLRDQLEEEGHHRASDIQGFLDRQAIALLDFDNGIVFFDSEGVLRAVNPMQPDVVGMDFSFRDYFQVTARTRRPYFSGPIRSRQEHRHLIIMFTEPVEHADGSLLGVLGGSLDLLKNNYLDNLIKGKIGRSGYYTLIDSSGYVILHPDREDLQGLGAGLFDRAAIQQMQRRSEGSFGVQAIAGKEYLGVYRRLGEKDWFLVALYPVTEAFAPIHQARAYALALITVLALVTLLVVRNLSNRLVSPLISLSGKVRRLADDSSSVAPSDIVEFKELGDLAESIHSLMADVAARRKDSHDQLVFMENLVDTIPCPIFYKDADFRYLGCNSHFELFIGYSREELVGKTTYDIAPRELADVYQKADQELWDRGGDQVYEATVKYADGSLHDVIFYKSVFRDAEGEKSGLIGAFLDITERKRSEIALQRSEGRFRLLVENAADAFYLHDTEGRVLDFNLQACHDLGYTREELRGMKVSDFSVDFDPEAVGRLQEVLREKQQATIVDRHRRKDGTVFPVEVRLCLAEEEGGLTIALARDITERREQEKALEKAFAATRAAGAQVANILQSVADGLIVTDHHNRVTHINHVAEAILGVSAPRVVGKSFVRLFQNPELRQQAREFLATGHPEERRYDFVLERPGHQYPMVVQARSSRIDLEEGGPGLVTILSDVTRERELDRIKSEFISTAAHEMRTPMSVISGYAELLRDPDQFGSFSPEQTREFSNEIYQKCEALTVIIDDLFDISRIEAGLPVPLDLAECNLSDIIRDVVKRYDGKSARHGFELELPDVVTVFGDRNKLTQVMENLVSNAVKYSPAGGTIRIESNCSDRVCEIVVIDQGIGMTEEQLERVFDKFYRADSSDTAVGGLGLGMSIAKSIVEGHEGRIRVESAPGEGTCVSLELPVAERRT